MKSLWVILYGWVTGRRIFFLKCDRKGCAYIEFHKQLDAGMINKPCPLCGSNLLTAPDFNKLMAKQ
jgi:hypothetical protein